MGMDSKNFDLLKPKVVLGVAAHPDDLDFGASGTMAKWIGAGAEVYYLILTDGSKGTDDENISSAELIKIRREEQKKACEILGAKDVFFLDHEDGALECNTNVKRDIARVIRQVKPNVLITFDPSVLYSAKIGFINHPDHRAAGQAALDALYPLARDHLSMPELLAEGLEPHKVRTVLLMNFDEANYFEDITEVFDKKCQALAAHKSQQMDGQAQEIVKQFAHEAGKAIGAEYAESFVRIDVN
jgi:LmbE family N-acetylglucosaminyl deacetylase